MAKTGWPIAPETAQALQNLREEMKLSYGKLAGELQLSQDTITKIFSNKSVEAATHEIVREYLSLAGLGTPVLLGTRPGFHIRNGSNFDKIIREAKSLVYLSGVNIIKATPYKWLHDFLSQKPEGEAFDLRFMICDPASTEALGFAKYDETYEDPGQFKSSLIIALDAFQKLRKAFPQFFDYRLLPFVPSFALFIIDKQRDDGGYVKAEIYCAKPWRIPPLRHRPSLFLDRSTEPWRTYFLTQWENQWNLGNEPRELTEDEAKILKANLPTSSSKK